MVEVDAGSALSRDEAVALAPADLRAAIRDGRWAGSTEGLALGHLQANLVVLPHELAFEFLLYCHRNTAACPVIDVGEVGSTTVPGVAAEADLRTDLPRYRVYADGELVDEPTEVAGEWPEDAVAFLLGCAMTCDEALLAAGVPVRHLAQGRRAPVYVTDVPTRPAGAFSAPLVVNLRAVPAGQVARATTVTSRYPVAHGAPVHVGEPAALGIADLADVTYGDAPWLEPGDVPMFWGCGITPQLAIERARPRYAITHFPGHMFVTDRAAEADAAH